MPEKIYSHWNLRTSNYFKGVRFTRCAKNIYKTDDSNKETFGELCLFCRSNIILLNCESIVTFNLITNYITFCHTLIYYNSKLLESCLHSHTF